MELTAVSESYSTYVLLSVLMFTQNENFQASKTFPVPSQNCFLRQKVDLMLATLFRYALFKEQFVQLILVILLKCIINCTVETGKGFKIMLLT